jgi:hypothetical protein
MLKGHAVESDQRYRLGSNSKVVLGKCILLRGEKMIKQKQIV